jgi:hypothetical protein
VASDGIKRHAKASSGRTTRGAALTAAIGHTLKTWLRCVIVGTDGLRAGCLVVIAVTMAVAIALGLRVAMQGKLAFPAGQVTPRIGVVLEGIQAALVLAITPVMGWIGGKPVWAYGLRGQCARRWFRRSRAAPVCAAPRHAPVQSSSVRRRRASPISVTARGARDGGRQKRCPSPIALAIDQ